MSGNTANYISPIKSTFEVYKESDFNGVSVSGNAANTEVLCQYYFSYIIYDTLELNQYSNKEKYKYKYEKIFNDLYEQIISNINTFKDNGDEYEYINTFFAYVLKIFSAVNHGGIIDANNTFSISQGQYLDHLDTIYERYNNIISRYTKEKDISTFEVSDIIIKQSEITSTNISITQRVSKYYISFIKEKYATLETLYKTNNKFFITDNDTNNKISIIKYGEEQSEYDELFKEKQNINKEITDVIEDILYFYYRYEFVYASQNTRNFISEGLKNRARNSSLLCAIFKIFEKNNKNLIQLLLFKDKFFNKLITNIDTDNDTKIIMLEKYQMLEKKIRRAFLNDKNTKFVNNPFVNESIFLSFYNIINYRLYLYGNYGYDENMKNVVNFYRPGRLIQYYNENKKNIGIISSKKTSQNENNIPIVPIIQLDNDTDNDTDDESIVSEISSTIESDNKDTKIDISDIEDTDIIVGVKKIKENTNQAFQEQKENNNEYEYINFDFNKKYTLHANDSKQISETAKTNMENINHYKNNYNGSLFVITDYTIYPAQKKHTLCNIPEEIYLSYFNIGKENTLTNEKMILITDQFITYIFNEKTKHLYTEEYSKDYTKCILIEKILGNQIVDNIVDNNKYNKLFFITNNEIEQEVFNNDIIIEDEANDEIKDL